jgi:hypothetical protein
MNGQQRLRARLDATLERMASRCLDSEDDRRMVATILESTLSPYVTELARIQAQRDITLSVHARELARVQAQLDALRKAASDVIRDAEPWRTPASQSWLVSEGAMESLASAVTQAGGMVK